MPGARHDIIILGGGLAGGLAALSLAKFRPGIDLVLVEAGKRIGGNHLWSFFDSDIAPEDQSLVDPLIVHRWPSYDVRFPAHARTIDQSYRTIESEQLDAAVRTAIPAGSIVRQVAAAATPTKVTFGDGSEISARAVLDTRGLTATPQGLACGWQKFVGQLLHVPDGHGIVRPVVMDATVRQLDGYRFVYCLPFSPTEIFVEDTYYSDTPDLDRGKLSTRIADYASAQGWAVGRIGREEQGVLPVVMGGDFDRFWPSADKLAKAGVRGGFFHPLTSYSLPDAVRLAGWLGREAPLDGGLGTAMRQRAARHWSAGRFDRMLARMLLRAAEPAERYRILQRFYRLPSPLIARFYAGRATAIDRLRILAGKPPVPIGSAVRTMMEKM